MQILLEGMVSSYVRIGREGSARRRREGGVVYEVSMAEHEQLIYSGWL